MGKHEFDELIGVYRESQAKAVAISGETSEFFSEYKVRMLAGWFPEWRNAPIRVLDFGCSDGMMTAFVKRVFPNAAVCGVDPSAPSIAIAAKNHPDIEFSAFERSLPFADGAFDLAFASGVFHHIGAEDHSFFAAEVMRVLRPGGAFVLFEMNPWSPAAVWIFKHSVVDRNARMFSARYAKTLFAPFGRIQSRFILFFPRALRWLRPAEPLLSRCPLGAQYALLIRKPRES